MSESFSVGEVAIIARSALAQFPVGMEVTILGILPDCPCGMYHIGNLGIVVIVANASELRKKKPPHESVVSWESVPYFNRIRAPERETVA